jgi:hypothetical protein
MAPTESSCRAIFRAVAQTPHNEWPAYDSTQLYDRSSPAALREDIHTVAREWFDHDAHESVDQFVCHYPLEYVEFDPHDRYTDSTQYGIEQLVRVFLIQELRGWTHETAIVTYLQQQPSLRRDRTPLGHIHRDHLRDLSIEEIREMYRRAMRRLIDRTAETDEFHRAGIVAIDITEADPFTVDLLHTAEAVGFLRG